MDTKTDKNLTPEQRELLMATFAKVTELIVPAIEQVLAALKPVIEAYNKLPIELKNEIGMRQVIDKLNAGIETPDPATEAKE